MEMCQLKNIRLQEMNQRVNDCMATWHEQKTKNFFFRNDSLVLTRVFSHRSYISEKKIYQKFISKIILT